MISPYAGHAGPLKGRLGSSEELPRSHIQIDGFGYRADCQWDSLHGDLLGGPNLCRALRWFTGPTMAGHRQKIPPAWVQMVKKNAPFREWARPHSLRRVVAKTPPRCPQIPLVGRRRFSLAGNVIATSAVVPWAKIASEFLWRMPLNLAIASRELFGPASSVVVGPARQRDRAGAHRRSRRRRFG
jgi:hypothetical protein